jgi:hypothetical protein
LDLKTYIVYCLDYTRQVSEPIGELTEHRRKDRVNDIEDLLKWAERIFSSFPPDSRPVITPE